MFQFKNQLNFFSLLADCLDLASAVMRTSYIDNLNVLPAGSKPPNPQDLLKRSTLNELFQYARKVYDIVLINTSSLSTGADALIVAAKTGAALAVARANETKLAAFTDMLTELERSSIHMVGSVLNIRR
jgi:protein-tyrosine kinase